MCCEWLPRGEVTLWASRPVFTRRPAPCLLAALPCFLSHSFSLSFPRFVILAIHLSLSPSVPPPHSYRLPLIPHLLFSLLLAFLHFTFSIGFFTCFSISLFLCLFTPSVNTSYHICSKRVFLKALSESCTIFFITAVSTIIIHHYSVWNEELFSHPDMWPSTKIPS